MRKKTGKINAETVCRALNSLHDGFLLLVLVVAMLIAAYCLYDGLYIYFHASGGELAKYKPGNPSYSGEDSPITDEMVGWITLDNTGIDFPVMQGSNNLTFLNRDPYGRFSMSGSIFLDSRNSPDFTDSYSLIYGHHMEYGRMFGALDAFLNREYAASHRYGTLLIGRDGSESHRLTVFAVLKTQSDERKIFDVDDPRTTRDFIASHASISLGEPGDRIVALSTCDRNDNTMRILLACSMD